MLPTILMKKDQRDFTFDLLAEGGYGCNAKLLVLQILFPLMILEVKQKVFCRHTTHDKLSSDDTLKNDVQAF